MYGMKLFSFGKQKQQAEFLFRVEDSFSLRDGGVVVAGQVTRGVLRRGERAVCLPEGGSPFPCTIDAIEQPDPRNASRFLHPEEVRAGGPFQGHCALRIPGRTKGDFAPGDRIVSEGFPPEEL